MTTDLTRLQRTAQNAAQKIADADVPVKDRKDELWRLMVWCKKLRDQITQEEKN